jgi:DNA-binding transcriptional LysR family regulator
MDLEVRHLRVIYTIAEAGSLRRASTVLQVSQPALTAQLQRIERLVGGQLFRRGQTGAVPTVLGAEFLTRANSVLHAFDDLQRDMATESEANADSPLRVRVATSEGPLLGGMVARLRTRFPDAEITVRSLSSDRSPTAMLEAGLVDLLITGDYPGHEIELPPGTAVCPIVTEPTFAVLAADHPFCADLPEHEVIGPAELAGQEWVFPPDNDGGCEYILGAFARCGDVRPSTRQRAGGSALRTLIRANSGIAFAQATSPGSVGLAIRSIKETPIWYRHVLVWRRNHPIAGHATALRQAAIECYTAAIADSPVFQHWLDRHGMRSDPSSLFAVESAEPFGIVRHCA